VSTLGLEALPDRCAHGYAPIMHPSLCECAELTEWAIFVRALRASADDHGEVSQTRMRPLIASIPHKHRGSLYRRAVSLGLIEQTGWEPSTDAAGRNTDKQQRRYVLRGKAAA